MAQSGFTPIQLYRTATASATPSAGNLADGELAINTNDGRLFYKDSGGAVQTIAWKTTPVSAGGTGATTLTGYVKGSGTSPLTASSTIPGSDISGNIPGNAANVTGVVAAANGGTGQSSYTVGDLLFADGSTSLAKLPDVATGNALISGGVGVAPTYGKIGLTTHVSGTLPVANGGTGVTTSTGSGSVVLSASPTLSGTPTVSGTAALGLPVGTTGERPTASTGLIRFNTTLGGFEGYNGTAWTSVGGGATGGGSDQTFYLNGQTVNNSYSIPVGQNAGTFGPITVASGAVVTVPSGSTWTVV